MKFLRTLRETPPDLGDSYLSALLAYQETESATPTVVTVNDPVPAHFLESLIYSTCQVLEEKNSLIPNRVAAELITNLAHAEFRRCVITVSADGNQLTVSDHGPGIPNKEKALLLGYYGEPPESYRSLIRGAGTGLPLAHQLITAAGGDLILTDNLIGGTVATALVRFPVKQTVLDIQSMGETAGAIKQRPRKRNRGQNDAAKAGDPIKETEDNYLRITDPKAGPSQLSDAEDAELIQLNTQGPAVAEALSDLQTKLSRRQRRVLFLVADLGEVGPSTASTELDMSLSTAFRDLVVLEEMGLVHSDPNGKRSLTPLGARVIAALSV